MDQRAVLYKLRGLQIKQIYKPERTFIHSNVLGRCALAGYSYDTVRKGQMKKAPHLVEPKGRGYDELLIMDFMPCILFE